jgi:hypothetical protein
MQINRALLESSDITKHFMTATERQVKKKLCQLLIDKGHRKYAERFWKFDFNIIDSKKHPDFTAAISFDEATVFISDGFLGSGEGIFNQLDVLLRHELAHNLMMHQIRMMHVFKKKHASNPDEIYKRISYSASIHKLLNIIEDFEISNKRYSNEDKNIVRNMMLNGQVIGGLVTEDNRGWDKMPLEQMYEELSNELIAINSAIRSDPAWQPKAKQKNGQMVYDAIELSAGQAAAQYKNVMNPSGIKAPIDIFMKTKTFRNFPKELKDIVIKIYEALKDCTEDSDKQKLLDTLKDIADSGIQETFILVNPIEAKTICELYTPEEKMLASDIIKNLIGNINYNPHKFNIKRKNNSQEYKDAWNTVIKQLDSSKFDDETLKKLRDALKNA